MNIDREDLAYLAGMVDGEGSITLSKSSNKNAFRVPCLSVSSTDLELLYPFMVLGGRIAEKKSRAKLKHWKTAYEYRLKGKKAQEALALLLPYLRHPKKRVRAVLLTYIYPDTVVRNGKYSDDQKQIKYRFEKAFLSLT